MGTSTLVRACPPGHTCRCRDSCQSRAVRRSLANNGATVLSIFVNPAQFAPHEDYGTYPKTFDHDMKQFADALAESRTHTDALVFLPSVKEMYPSGIVLNVPDQRGTFVEVNGFSHQMEGKTRPTFFRGVATVNIRTILLSNMAHVSPTGGVKTLQRSSSKSYQLERLLVLMSLHQPTRAYFGQKDIQQALILRRLTSDLLLSHPLPSNLVIVPTHRSTTDGLALSSRNAYLSDTEREYASTLYAALCLAQREWEGGSASAEQALTRARELVQQRTKEAKNRDVELRLDYITITDPETFEPVDWAQRDDPTRTAILGGALFVGKTRLIDNLLCGDISTIVSP
jgi:pantoate--beta-alanine ligase